MTMNQLHSEFNRLEMSIDRMFNKFQVRFLTDAKILLEKAFGKSIDFPIVDPQSGEGSDDSLLVSDDVESKDQVSPTGIPAIEEVSNCLLEPLSIQGVVLNLPIMDREVGSNEVKVFDEITVYNIVIEDGQKDLLESFSTMRLEELRVLNLLWKISNDSKPETRSPLGIDLNEIPSSSSFTETLPDSAEHDSFSIVRDIHENPDPALGEAAGVPVGNERDQCGACGLPVALAGGGRVVVCDGCERGFHLACSGVSGSFSTGEERVCVPCVGRGVRSKRWRLGFKAKKRILDINASPPSDGDGEGEEVQELMRQHMHGYNSFVGNGLGAPLTFMNSLYDVFGSQKAPRIVTHAVKMGFEDLVHHMRTRDRSFDEVDLDSPLRMLSNSNSTTIRFSTRNPSDAFLQALRDFVSERHGVLEEGWRVELKHSISGCDLYAVYCAPDGKTFGSVAEVASFLGLMSNYNPMNSEIKHEGDSRQERLHLPRKRKSARFSIASGFPENKGSLIKGYYKEFPCNGPIVEKHVKKSCIMEFTEGVQDDKCSSGSEQINDGLPVQFEDFFVLSFGVIDKRPSYHDASLIYPIGYRSCWHDKNTGSLFVFEVLDGGDSGPIFKKRRCSCSALPLPIG